MKRSESQSLYTALPEACITYTNNSRDNRKKCTDKRNIRITYWNSKNIPEDDIYYSKIINQIMPDLYNFKSDDNKNIKPDNILSSLFKKRERVKFLEINPYNDGAQILGHIFPKLFYCPKCGKIKFLKYDKDIENMFCDCTGKSILMNQYNRMWVCSCGEIYSINEKEVDPLKLRYFASEQDHFIEQNGKIHKKLYKKCPKCGNTCSLMNVTDQTVYIPRTITSVKLTENKEAELCLTEEGRELIINRQIGKIGDEEFKKKSGEILEKNNSNIEVDTDSNDDFGFDFLENLKSVDKKVLSEDNVEKETLYRILEYNTLKRKILTDKSTSIKNAKIFGKISDESEINDMLRKLKIKDISSVSGIEIIDTAYGYTRNYKDPEEVNKKNETFVLRAFHDSKSSVANFYNIRTKTEGIIIDIDKRALYNYLKDNYSKTKKFMFKELTDEELNKWFLEKTNLDTKLIKKFEEIDTKNGNMTCLYTKCVYELLHTISHMFINTISRFCGMDKSSLSEMIFLNAGSILIYSKTNQGAILGALTQTFDKYLYEMLKSVYRDNETCIFDPLCMDTSRGSCCACSYLDEVACEHFNKDLSRRLLYGYEDNDEKIINFWEEI